VVFTVQFTAVYDSTGGVERRISIRYRELW